MLLKNKPATFGCGKNLETGNNLSVPI